MCYEETELTAKLVTLEVGRVTTHGGGDREGISFVGRAGVSSIDQKMSCIACLQTCECW